MASLSDQLKAAKLRKSKEPVKRPKAAGFISGREMTLFPDMIPKVIPKKGLSILHEHTFPTDYCPMSVQEAELIVAVYERMYKNLDPPSIASINWRDRLSSEEGELVLKLESRLQNVMDRFLKSESDYVTVNTSSGSVKHAPVVQEHIKKLYQQFLSEEAENVRNTENTKITCLTKAAFLAKRVRSAGEVVDRMMQSESIYNDMLEALDDDVKEMFHENLVVRAFVDIDVDMELRGFVFDGSLVALSQYHYLTYSPRLVEKQDELQARILSFYQNILKPKLQWNNFGKFERAFIIDFAVGSKDDKLWVTRIKPFMATVDAALFSWDRERHLLEGEEGFQFRINTRPKPGAKTMLPHSLKAILSV